MNEQFNESIISFQKFRYDIFLNNSRLQIMIKALKLWLLIPLLSITSSLYASELQQKVTQDPIKIVNLANTDGTGLVAKLPKLSAEERKRLYSNSKKSCNDECVAPFGTVLGTANKAIAYSNCNSECLVAEYSFLNLKTSEITNHKKFPKDENLHYVGLTYQCVEYARKWWMLNKGITFGDIGSAFEIIYLTEGKHIYSKESFPLARSLNGSASRAPKVGDLVIYSADRSSVDWMHGHVAVVVAVDLKEGSVSLAEENYNNLPWQDPEQFARKIQLFEVSGRYTLIDVAVNTNKNATGAQISGWIYPKKGYAN